jgi:hypothetical protein
MSQGNAPQKDKYTEMAERMLGECKMNWLTDGRPMTVPELAEMLRRFWVAK